MDLLKAPGPLVGMELERAAVGHLFHSLTSFISSHQIRPALIELMKEKIRWEGELWPSEQRN